MKESLDVVIEVDFETYGIKPKGELLRQVSKVLSDLSAYGDLNFRSGLSEDLPIKVAHMLLECYVTCQEIIFKNYGTHTKGWQARRLVWTFFNACLYRHLQKALNFRDQIKDVASASELCRAALGIIHEYETYLSHKSEIDKHIKAQRKIIDSKYEEFLIALENATD